MLTTGEIIKDTVIAFNADYAGNLNMHLYSLAKLSKEYKIQNGNFDMQKFCYEHGIPRGCIGKFVKDYNDYGEYKAENATQTINHLYTKYDKDGNISLVENDKTITSYDKFDTIETDAGIDIEP